MPKIPTYPAQAPADLARADKFVLARASNGATRHAEWEDAVPVAYGGIGFESKATNLGAVGTTWTPVTGYDLSFAVLGFTLTPGDNRLDIPVAGTYELRYEMSLDGSGGARLIQVRLTKNGVAITGTQRSATSVNAAEPAFIAGSVLLDGLAASDAIRVEARFSGGTTTGNLNCEDGALFARFLRPAS